MLALQTPFSLILILVTNEDDEGDEGPSDHMNQPLAFVNQPF